MPLWVLGLYGSLFHQHGGGKHEILGMIKQEMRETWVRERALSPPIFHSLATTIYLSVPIA